MAPKEKLAEKPIAQVDPVARRAAEIDAEVEAETEENPRESSIDADGIKARHADLSALMTEAAGLLGAEPKKEAEVPLLPDEEPDPDPQIELAALGRLIAVAVPLVSAAALELKTKKDAKVRYSPATKEMARGLKATIAGARKDVGDRVGGARGGAEVKKAFGVNIPLSDSPVEISQQAQLGLDALADPTYRKMLRRRGVMVGRMYATLLSQMKTLEASIDAGAGAGERSGPQAQLSHQLLKIDCLLSRAATCIRQHDHPEYAERLVKLVPHVRRRASDAAQKTAPGAPEAAKDEATKTDPNAGGTGADGGTPGK